MQNNPTKKHPILTISFFNGIILMLGISLNFYLALYFSKIGFSGEQIGLIFALGTLTSIITILPSGLSNDRHKSKHLITLGVLLIASQFFGFSLTHSFPLILAVYLIGRCGKMLFATSIDSLFYKMSEKDTTKKIALYHGIQHMLIGIGIFIAGYLLKSDLTFENVFLIWAIMYVIMAGIGQLFLPSNETFKFNILQYKKDTLQPKVLIFMLIVFLFGFHYGAEGTSYGLFLNKTLGLNEFQMGIYMGIAIFIMGLAAFVISKNFKKWKAKNILLFALLANGIGHILMTTKIIDSII